MKDLEVFAGLILGSQRSLPPAHGRVRLTRGQSRGEHFCFWDDPTDQAAWDTHRHGFSCFEPELLELHRGLSVFGRG